MTEARKRTTTRAKARHASANGRPKPDAKFADEVQARVRQMEVQEAARRLVAAENAGEPFRLPKPGQTLADDLAEPRREAKYRIEGLHPSGGNSVLVSQFKAGKTTLAMNLARSLTDGLRFLNHFEVTPLDGCVAFLNYELDEDMFREWARDVEFARPERFARPLHLRGHRLPFWDPQVRDEAATWLRGNEVEFLILDPAARAWSGLVDNENDNVHINEFCNAVDELKRAAGVKEVLVCTHTGRAQAEEGEERSRGGTRLEDWMDAGWYLTKDRAGNRFMRAIGRDVDLDAIALQYDPGNRRIYTTGQTRVDQRTQDGVQAAVDALAILAREGGDPPTTTALKEAMQGDKTHRSQWIAQAESDGLITREKVGNALRCNLTESGQKLHARRVTKPTVEGS